MTYTGLADRAALVQRDMANTVAEFRPAKARTLATFESGRSVNAQLAGYQIPYWKNHAHGSGTTNPLSTASGSTSYRKSVKQTTGAMYGGPAFRYMNIYLQADVLKDMESGKIPDSYIQERRRRIETFMMKKNWAAIGDGTGTIAIVNGNAAGSTITCLASNVGRGTSKGVFRLKMSDASDPLWYSAIEQVGFTEQARFYVTAILSETTCTAVFTGGVGLITDVDDTDHIVEYATGWNKEMIGLAGHISDQNRIYQGADTSVDTFLKNPKVPGGSAAPTPTMVDSAKNIAMTRGNNLEGRNGLLGHISQVC